VTGDLDKEERRAGGGGNDLGAASTGCDGGVDKPLREEGLLTCLSPPIFGKTEVTRELDEKGPSSLPNAYRPRPVGAPVRWGRAVHCEGQAWVSFCIS
jgi:hypothetical protein